MENTQKNIEENLQSSKKHSYNLHSPGVRTYKDSVFCRIFNEKKELLSLYNALNMSHYENPDDLEIITLDNALFLQMKNDVAFLINTNEMCLIERRKRRRRKVKMERRHKMRVKSKKCV